MIFSKKKNPRRIRWFLSLQDVLLTTTAHIAGMRLNLFDAEVKMRTYSCEGSYNRKGKVGRALAKAAVLRINLNLDGSRLLTSSLSLGVPVPRPTQCVRGG